MKEKVLSYIKDVLEVPRDEYNGMPTCPFAKQERESDNIYIDTITSDYFYSYLIVFIFIHNIIY
jgi:hypothetical protein